MLIYPGTGKQQVVTTAELMAIMPLANELLAAKFAEEFNRKLPGFQIDGPMRLAAFIAQGAADTYELKQLSANLCLPAGKIMAAWPGRFARLQDAQAYAYDNEKLCNYLYARKGGNGTLDTGDGYRYRGRGWFHGQGRDYYAQMKDSMAVDFLSFPDLITLPYYAVLAACIRWEALGLNEVCDSGNIRKVFKLLSAKDADISRQMGYYHRAAAVLGKSETARAQASVHSM